MYQEEETQINKRGKGALFTVAYFLLLSVLMVPAQAYVAQWLSSFKEYPPRQKPGSFSLDQVMGQLVSMSGDN